MRSLFSIDIDLFKGFHSLVMPSILKTARVKAGQQGDWDGALLLFIVHLGMPGDVGMKNLLGIPLCRWVEASNEGLNAADRLARAKHYAKKILADSGPGDDPFDGELGSLNDYIACFLLDHGMFPMDDKLEERQDRKSVV